MIVPVHVRRNRIAHCTSFFIEYILDFIDYIIGKYLCNRPRYSAYIYNIYEKQGEDVKIHMNKIDF